MSFLPGVRQALDGGKRLTFSEALTFQINPMRSVNDAVQDRVPDCVVRDNFMPSADGDLAGDQQRSFLLAIIDNFQQVASLFCGQWLGSPVVDDQQPGALQRSMRRERRPSPRAVASSANRREARR